MHVDMPIDTKERNAMSEKPYVANFNSAISYLKIGQNDLAKDSIARALPQVPQEEKSADNPVYLKILALAARFAIEEKDYETAGRHIGEGLELNAEHADLLFLNALIAMDGAHYEKMFAEFVKYLLACSTEGTVHYDYDYTNQAAVLEVLQRLLPMAYERIRDRGPLRTVVEKLCTTSGNELLKKAYEHMLAVDKTQ